MKHFIIEIIYRIPADQLGEARLEHRRHLQENGYARGLLLFSGPLVPATGGLIVARAAERAEIDDLIAHDPYNLRGVADYRVIEFDPLLRQDWLLDWIDGK